MWCPHAFAVRVIGRSWSVRYPVSFSRYTMDWVVSIKRHSRRGDKVLVDHFLFLERTHGFGFLWIGDTDQWQTKDVSNLVVIEGREKHSWQGRYFRGR